MRIVFLTPRRGDAEVSSVLLGVSASQRQGLLLA
jgi:hypothetical protein